MGVLLAGAALLANALARGHRPGLRARWRTHLRLGALNAASPFVLVAAAQLHLTASPAAIPNGTTPLWTALVAAAWIGEPLTRGKTAAPD